MDELKPEERLRATLEEIGAHAETLLSEYKRHRDDYAYIRDLLSPDGNNACIKLGRLMRLLLMFPPGTIAPSWLTEWHSSSMRLLDELKRDHPEIVTLHHTWNAQKGLYDLLTVRYEEYSEDEYFEEIKIKCAALKNKYRENSNGMNELCVKMREMPRAKPRVRAADPETARRRADKRAMLKVICESYDKAHEKGRKVSYSDIVRELKNGAYAARLRGKKVETWANQASAFGKRVSSWAVA